MTVCKISKRDPLIKGQIYRKTTLLGEMFGSEKMASTYFDPPRDELFSFFDENGDWINTFQNGILQFRHKTIEKLGEAPAWERTKIRHIFLRYKGHKAGNYEYLGFTIDEERKTSGSFDTKEYRIM